tara:strand:- start:314 stop:739 length:426 start_codon:yes stop_codon:yes gene_type:complete
MGVQPLNLEDRIEIVDPNYRVPDEFPVMPQDTFMGFTWGRVNLGRMRQFVFEDVVREWFGHQEPMIFNHQHHQHHRIFFINNYMFVNMKKKEKKSKKEKEYKDLMNQILNHVDVSYTCNYCVEKEVEHSYSPSAPISSLVR